MLYLLVGLIGCVVTFIFIDVIFVWRTLKIKKVRTQPKNISRKPGTTINLYQCPFCGQSVQVLITEEKDGRNYYSIVCDAQEGGCGASTGKYADPLDAVLMWNVRPEDFEWLQKIESMQEWKI